LAVRAGGVGQSIATSYTYQPFGATTLGGAANGNVYQFTDRENDGTGLFFYRARYYSPTYQRFIAQDPIDFASRNANVNSYVFNDQFYGRTAVANSLIPASPIGNSVKRQIAMARNLTTPS
jgi:RHS repeat-associated protein